MEIIIDKQTLLNMTSEFYDGDPKTRVGTMIKYFRSLNEDFESGDSEINATDILNEMVKNGTIPFHLMVNFRICIKNPDLEYTVTIK